jgi:tetratricopeptide (TPR) repeat protein
MLGFGWLALRQAQEALRNGRLDEAQRLLSQPAAQGQRGAGDLLARLARAYVERGERQLELDDTEAAWRDLLQAEHLQSAPKATERLRQALGRLGLAEVRALLQVGEPGRADEAVTRLRERGLRSPELRVLEEGVKGWLKAQDLADQGEFGPATGEVERALKLLGPVRRLEEFRNDLDRRQQAYTGLLAQLHEAADAGRWREVVELAEQVLAFAPNHAEARKARARAWKAIEPVTVAMGAPCTAPQTNGEPIDGLPLRFLLWIDGVGGYLVCLGSRNTFGQAIVDARVDVPLVADVSRLHATLTRDPEGYVLEAVRPIQVNGQEVTRALLRNGDRVTLGTSCQFLFRQPVPVSNTARLDLVSGHRLPLAVDGVLVMADTLVLGDGPQAHITVPDLKQPVVLFRHKDGLGLRHNGKLLVNGQKSPERGLLGPHAAVTGEDISFAIEPVGSRLGQ